MKRLLIILLMLLLSTLIFSDNTDDRDEKFKPFDKKNDQNEKNWRRHFFEFSLVGGGHFIFDSAIINSKFVLKTVYDLDFDQIIKYELEHNYNNLYSISYVIDKIYGANIGLSLNYTYAFSRYFGFGPGFSFFIPVDLIHFSEHTTYLNGIGSSGGYFFSCTNFGAYLTANFMIGDLKNKKIAFLFDVGDGAGFCYKFGIFIKGFSFKVGYNMPWSCYLGVFVHTFTCDIGYKLNWASKSL